MDVEVVGVLIAAAGVCGAAIGQWYALRCTSRIAADDRLYEARRSAHVELLTFCARYILPFASGEWSDGTDLADLGFPDVVHDPDAFTRWKRERDDLVFAVAIVAGPEAMKAAQRAALAASAGVQAQVFGPDTDRMTENLLGYRNSIRAELRVPEELPEDAADPRFY